MRAARGFRDVFATGSAARLLPREVALATVPMLEVLRMLQRLLSFLAVVAAVLAAGAAPAAAATIQVSAGGDLQAAIDAAQPGDTILLEPGAVFVGMFTLPEKGSSTQFITIRSAAADALLPAEGVRMTPAYAASLPKIRSGAEDAAFRTIGAAHHWRLLFLEFQASANGASDIIRIGTGSSIQNDLALVPHDFVIDRVLVRGDPLLGQKRCVALHGAHVTVINSYVSDCKKSGQDAQAIGGYNGPGPYTIENNYLEGAAENILFGGADPWIPNLVPADITVRRNHMTKPLAWRDPIVATPSQVNAATAGGSLAAGTYGYKVVARRSLGGVTMARSTASAEALATLSAQGGIALNWTAVADATEYQVYRTAGGTAEFWTVTIPSFVDTGAAGAAGTAPTTIGTRWTVKNIVELKNGERVLIDGNLLEYSWYATQTGYAILLKSTNQEGRCDWCIVRDVTVSNNVIRHTTGGVNINGVEWYTGDPTDVPRPAANLTIRGNLFYDSGAQWGTSAWWVQIGNSPVTVTLDHNTVIHLTRGMLYLYDQNGDGTYDRVEGLTITNNVARRNSYGIDGVGSAEGNDTLTKYGGVASRNAIAGASASAYPVDNFTPTVVDWEAEFVDYAAANYRLRPDSTYINAATDGTALGANVDLVEAEAAKALSGDNRGVIGPTPLTIITATVADGVQNTAYSTTLQASGGSGTYQWQLQSGALPAGLSLSASTGTIAGTPTTVETAAFEVTVWDGQSSATHAYTLQIFTLLSITTTQLPDGLQNSLYSATLQATGGTGTYQWWLQSGALPAGLSLDGATGAITGSPTSAGIASFEAAVQDGQAETARALTIAVYAPLAVTTTKLSQAKVNRPYEANLSASGGSGSYTWQLASGALPAGLVLKATGRIDGTPTTRGTAQFVVQVSDTQKPGLAPATQSLSITVR
jgi:hypothetical protein